MNRHQEIETYHRLQADSIGEANQVTAEDLLKCSDSFGEGMREHQRWRAS
jgi:hypothetical protein